MMLRTAANKSVRGLTGLVIQVTSVPSSRAYGHKLEPDYPTPMAASKGVYLPQYEKSEVWQIPYKQEYGLTQEMLQEYKETILDKPNENFLYPDFWPKPSTMEESFYHIQYPSDARNPSWSWEAYRWESVKTESGKDVKMMKYKTHRTLTYILMTMFGFYVVKGFAHTFIGAKGIPRHKWVAGVTEITTKGIAPGTTGLFHWRKKPVFVYHRTEQVIERERAQDITKLRDPEHDDKRHAPGTPQWLIVVGVCTHLGCVPIFGSGDYNGWFCPCHGSHYDGSGRVRAGPAPENLEVPEMEWKDSENLVIGKT